MKRINAESFIEFAIGIFAAFSWYIAKGPWLHPFLIGMMAVFIIQDMHHRKLMSEVEDQRFAIAYSRIHAALRSRCCTCTHLTYDFQCDCSGSWGPCGPVNDWKLYRRNDNEGTVVAEERNTSHGDNK